MSSCESFEIYPVFFLDQSNHNHWMMMPRNKQVPLLLITSIFIMNYFFMLYYTKCLCVLSIISLWYLIQLLSAYKIYQYLNKADTKFVPSQWEKALLCNNVSHWLGANLEWETVLLFHGISHWLGANLEWEMVLLCNDVSHWLGANLK